MFGRVWKRLLLAVALAAAAVPAAAQEVWRRAESPHFVIYSSAKEQVLRDYVLMLEDFDALLRTVHSRPLDEPVVRKLNVYLVDDEASFRRVYPDAASAIRGAYFAVEDDIFMVAVRADEATRRLDVNRGDDVVLHEYTHHFLQQYYPEGYPSWLNEGYAEYYMTADLGPRMVVVGGANRSRSQTLNSGQRLGVWLPVRSLLVADVNKVPDPLLETFYAESWLLTHYLMDDPVRRAGMTKYVAALKSGIDPVKAWIVTFNQTPEELDTVLKAYVAAPVLGTRRPRTWTAPTFSVAQLAPGAAEVLLDDQLFKRGAAASLAQPGLARVREAALHHPDEHAVEIALARGEVKFGDRAAGEAELRRLIAADSADSEALRVLALSRIGEGMRTPALRAPAFREAASLLAEAGKLDPNNYQILYRLVQTRSVEQGFPSADTLEMLKKAVALAPQVFGMRTAAAGVALRRGEVTTARELLEPVAADPHGGRTTAEARRMLADMDKSRPSAPPVSAP